MELHEINIFSTIKNTHDAACFAGTVTVLDQYFPKLVVKAIAEIEVPANF
jgi:hypothetical protein